MVGEEVLTWADRRPSQAQVCGARAHLADGGIGVVVVGLGTLFHQRREAAIREHLVRSDLLDAVIQLPPGLVAGTSVPVALLVLQNGRPQRSGQVLFVDAGNVWDEATRARLYDLRVNIGAGLTYSSPVGVIRADFGYQLNPIPGLMINGVPETRHWRVHFGIGHAF